MNYDDIIKVHKKSDLMTQLQLKKLIARSEAAKKRARALRVRLWLQSGWIDSIEEGYKIIKD